MERGQIDIAHAVAQHQAYEEMLAGFGVRLERLPALPDLPDGMFVEDPAVVLDEVAIIGRLGVESRRQEVETVAEALAQYRPLRRIDPPGTLEGGDVMVAGRSLYVGVSSRTNLAGIGQLEDIVRPLGYRVHPVPVHGCLHLKTACSYLGSGAVFVNREWLDASALEGLRLIDVREPWAANVLGIGDIVLMAAGFPASERSVREAGFQVDTLDVSELMKAEAGLTCMSLLFEGRC